MKIVLRFVLAAMVVGAALADAPPPSAAAPSAEELSALIQGNSTQGAWDGKPYKQFFSADGTTRYDEDGRRPSQGTWRINTAGQYCSIWPPSGNETCYNLLVDGLDIYWESRGGHQKATVVKGNIFN